MEVEQLLEKRHISLNDCPQLPLDVLPDLDSVQGHYGGGAGGYLECLFRYAAKELYGHEVDRMEYKVIRYELIRTGFSDDLLVGFSVAAFKNNTGRRTTFSITF